MKGISDVGYRISAVSYTVANIVIAIHSPEIRHPKSEIILGAIWQ